MNDLEITQAVSRVLSKYTKSAPQSQAHPPTLSTAPNRDNIEAIVASVLASRVSAKPAAALAPCDGAFATTNEAITAVQHAQIQYLPLLNARSCPFCCWYSPALSAGRDVAGHFQNGRGRDGNG